MQKTYGNEIIGAEMVAPKWSHRKDVIPFYDMKIFLCVSQIVNLLADVSYFLIAFGSKEFLKHPFAISRKKCR